MVRWTSPAEITLADDSTDLPSISTRTDARVDRSATRDAVDRQDEGDDSVH